eukprot:3999798-Amphidinium_carterae.1
MAFRGLKSSFGKIYVQPQILDLTCCAQKQSSFLEWTSASSSKSSSSTAERRDKRTFQSVFKSCSPSGGLHF